MNLPREISNLITEYKDNNCIRVRKSKITVCTDGSSAAVPKEVKVRNGLYTVSVSPMIFSGSSAFRCYLIHTPDYEIERLSHILLPFVNAKDSGWQALHRLTIMADSADTKNSLTIDMTKSNDTCLGAYDCRCRFTTQEMKEFDVSTGRCTFCHHNKEQHVTTKTSRFTLRDILQTKTTPLIGPEIYGDDRCLILPIYYSGYDFANIVYGFSNKAYEDFHKAYQMITEGKSGRLPNMSFPIPKGKDMRYYLPTATAQGNRIFITDKGVVKMKNSQKVMQEIDISEGNTEIKELYALHRRRRNINSNNITHYPYLVALQEQIMNDPAYTSTITVVIGDDWRSYHFLHKPYDGWS